MLRLSVYAPSRTPPPGSSSSFFLARRSKLATSSSSRPWKQRGNAPTRGPTSARSWQYCAQRSAGLSALPEARREGKKRPVSISPEANLRAPLPSRTAWWPPC